MSQISKEVGHRIQNIIQTVFKAFKEINYDCDNLILNAVQQESEEIIKLQIIIKQTTNLLLRYHSHCSPKQNSKTIKKYHNTASIPKSPKKFQQIVNEPRNEELLQKCFEGIKDLIEIYNILSKVHNDKNKVMIYKCMQEFENTFKCIQNSLNDYKSNNQSVMTIVNQLLNEKLITNTSYNFDSINNGNSNSEQNNKVREERPMQLNGQLSQKSTIIIDDLKEEISILNHALNSHDKNYEFKIHKYQEKLIDLSETVQNLKQILLDNQRIYQHEAEILHTQIYQYKLLVRNMARKIRNYQRGAMLIDGSSRQISSSRLLNKQPEYTIHPRERSSSRNYMCERLSREKIGNQSKRQLKISDSRRSSSRRSRELLRYSSNSLSRHKIV